MSTTTSFHTVFTIVGNVSSPTRWKSCWKRWPWVSEGKGKWIPSFRQSPGCCRLCHIHQRLKCVVLSFQEHLHGQKICEHIFYSFSLCIQVSDLSWLSSAVKVPFLLVPKTTKGKFHMAPPASIDLVGSYPLGTCIKPRITVDLAVTIPTVSRP